MKTVSTFAAIAIIGASASAFAGEDSTANWGPGGTGSAWYQTDCGLEGFSGPSVDKPKPACENPGRHYQTSDQGIVPTRVPSAVAGGSKKPVDDGHGGRKTPESRK